MAFLNNRLFRILHDCSKKSIVLVIYVGVRVSLTHFK